MDYMEHLLSCSLVSKDGTLDYVCRVMKKRCFVHKCENKGAYQLRRNRAANQCLCFRYIDRTLPLHYTPIIASLLLSTPFVSDLVANPKDMFSRDAAHVLLCVQKCINKDRSKTVSGLNKCPT